LTNSQARKRREFFNPTRRTATTLIEMLVVIGVLAIMLTMFLPAVQQAREAARRVECGNKLRQVGLGLLNFHSAANEFPVGCVEWRATNPLSRQIAWSAYLLPFIEQSQVHAMIDFDSPFDSVSNRAASKITIETYRCPSSARLDVINQFGLSDYGGMFGERITGPNSPAKGVMILDVAVSDKEILDGVSNTLIIAEDTRSSDGHWINGRNIFDQAFALNAGPAFENDIRSDHPGGANVCYSDSSIAFLANATDLKVLASLCTKDNSDFPN